MEAKGLHMQDRHEHCSFLNKGLNLTRDIVAFAQEKAMTEKGRLYSPDARGNTNMSVGLGN